MRVRKWDYTSGRQSGPEAGLPPAKLLTSAIGAPHSGIVPANTDEPFDFPMPSREQPVSI
jgi:hypothetical protein